MTDYLTMVEVLAMHADQIELYGEGEFSFDKLVPWLRSNVKLGS